MLPRETTCPCCARVHVAAGDECLTCGYRFHAQDPALARPFDPDAPLIAYAHDGVLIIADADK